MAAADANAQFQAALETLNFGARCHSLAALGKRLASEGLTPEKLEERLDALEAPGLPTAFVEKARLLVAKKAGCLGYSKKFLDHPSQSVRYSAVHGGLLRPSDARDAFLSEDSGRKLKKLLIKCPVLPCDEEVLQQAERLFGAQDKELLWLVLARAQDEQLFKKWLPKVTEWMEANYKESNVPGIPQLAMRFPETMLKLVEEDTLVFKWYWVMPLLSICPEKILRLTFIEDNAEGSGPLRNKQHYDTALASWGWRHQPECMLDLCQELGCADRVLESGGRGEWTLVRLVSSLMEVSSTKKYITLNQKLTLLVRALSRVPGAQKTPELVLAFAEQLPDEISGHRTKEIEKLISTFWEIVAEVGRAARRQVLVGPENKPALTDLLKCFLSKLPPPLAVDQFFQVLREFEAGLQTYRFVQSNICKTQTGEHDEIMGKVCERFLQKEDASAAEAAEMFQLLLQDAVTMDVVQRSFDLLTRRLGGHADLQLLQRVVQRMRTLEIQSRTASSLPKSTLPVPTAWVRFLQLPHAVEPHVDHLHRLLHSGAGEGEPLGVLLAHYGPGFFWDALAHVLQKTTGNSSTPVLPAMTKASLEHLSQLDLAGLAAPLREAVAVHPSALPADQPSEYFSLHAEMKSKTYVRDDSAREAGYVEMMRTAQKDKDPSAAFEDFLPFLVGRLNKEKEGVRCEVMQALLGQKLLSPSLWAAKLQYLRALYKVCAKTRTPLNELWRSVGHDMVSAALNEWEDGATVSEACIFGLEVGKTCKEELDLPLIFVEVSKMRKKKCQPPVCESAAKWVFETTVPVSGGQAAPHRAFWVALANMAEAVGSGEGGERSLWEQWSFLPERWNALLAEGVEQRAADFVLVGVIDRLVRDQQKYQISGEKLEGGWWAPITCAEYETAVASVLHQMETGRMPAREASAVLVRRIRAKLQKASAAGSVNFNDEPTRAAKWLENQSWDIQKHRKFMRMPCRPHRSEDSFAKAELETLSKLLERGEARRQVLWQITGAAAMLRGPLMQQLLQDAIACLNPQSEGMARCVARCYPYFNTALTKGEEQQGCPDVLTPLVEFWLADDQTRDAAVEVLMQRSDCHYFLFFGTSFTKHLSTMRQEWLHQCLDRLVACGAGGAAAEFYHYPKRGPSIVRIAQAGVKRYRIPCPRLRGGGSKRSKRAKLLAMRRQSQTKASTNEPMQLYLWHPHTQAQFLSKALTSTKPLSLAVIPRMEFADCITRVSELLASYPKDASVPEPDSDGWAWEVLQTAGAYSSLEVEIQRHFRELPAPYIKDAVGDPEVQQLLVGLGRADDAAAALVVLGKYAGKVKQAKEAVVKMVATLSPQQARKVMTEVMLTAAAGVALQVAALRLIGDLNIPAPLELYRVAWNNGACHRDIAVNIMSRLATSPATHWSAEEVRGFFDFFQLPDRAEDHPYVAEEFLNHLVSNPEWTLPFLPTLVEQLAMAPGATSRAINALQSTKTHVTEVVSALTRISGRVRMAVRARAALESKDVGTPEAQVMAALAEASPNFTTSLQARLEDCDSSVLWDFVLDQLQNNKARSNPSLAVVLSAWTKLLRKDNLDSWPTLLKQMEDRLARSGKPNDLVELASCVGTRSGRSILPKTSRDTAIMALRELFERILDSRLSVTVEERPEEDSQCKATRKAKLEAAQAIVMTHWPQMLVNGCQKSELERLWLRCPKGKRTKLATTIIDSAPIVAKRYPEKVPEVFEVQRETIAWLATPEEVRDQHLDTLLDLWGKVVARETTADVFPERLTLLGGPLPPFARPTLVDKLKEQRPSTPILRAALTWLSQEHPEEAVARWVSLLTNKESVEVGDIASLLSICEANGLSPPELPPLVARTLPDEAFQLFLRSTIPEARVVALQVLQAKHRSEAGLEALDVLCSDSLEVVSVAAKLLKASLANENRPTATATQSSSTGRRGGRGFGRGRAGGRGGRRPGRKPEVSSEEEEEEGSDSDGSLESYVSDSAAWAATAPGEDW